MTQTNAVASRPVVFFTDDGREIQIPLSTINFTDGTLSTTFPGDASTTKLLPYLQYLASIGQLVSDVAPTPPAGLVATATVIGEGGNRITIAVAPSAADATKVDITATQTDVYEGLKLSTIEATVGTTAAPGSGQLIVKTNTAGAPPPVADDDVDVGTGTNIDTWAIAAGVVLAPLRTDGPSGYRAADFKIAVSDIAGTGADTTFTLTITCKRTVPNIPAGAAVPASLADLKYLVGFTAPASGFKLPIGGTTSLDGGSAPSDGKAATTTLLANA